MISVQIDFLDLDNVPQTTTEQFHLSEVNALELEAQLDGGFEGTLAYIESIKDVDEIPQDKQTEVMTMMLDIMEKVVRLSYGKRTEAGGFRRDNAVTEEFLESPAYSKFIMTLLADQELTQKFWSEVIPKGMAEPAITPEKKSVVRK